VIVTYEDRPSHFVGLKLLALSLAKHSPDARLEIFVTGSTPELASWAAANHVRLRVGADFVPSGYDVKPTLLRRALESGAEEAIWLDSDIIVTRDPRSLWEGCSPETIVVAEEFIGAPAQGGLSRTRAWGLPLGRSLPNTTNSCIVRVTRVHLELLRAWENLLGQGRYREAQSLGWQDRPTHLMGDQDVLCALLGSQPFVDVPIRWVRRGPEIAHCFEDRGYVLHQRLANLFAGRTPLLLHGQGPKPWHLSGHVRPLHLELSPYTLAALGYVEQLGEPTEWAERQRSTTKLLRLLFRDHLTASGTLPAVLSELRDMRLAKTAARSLSRRLTRRSDG
jgi:hypothetical protein